MALHPSDKRWKTAAAVSHEAQRAFDEELRRGLSDDVRAALDESVRPWLEKFGDAEDSGGELPYQLIRYKPMNMKQEEFAKQLYAALHEWYISILKATEKK